MYDDEEHGPARKCAGCGGGRLERQIFCSACTRRIPGDIRRRLSWASSEDGNELEAAVREARIALGVTE